MNHKDAPEPICETVEQDCLRYLLGELDDPEKFEKRLSLSPELADELQAQAILIEQLSHCDWGRIKLAPAPKAASSWNPILVKGVAILALAASLLFVVLLIDSDSSQITRPRDSEELLIARAWVTEQHQDAFDDESFFVLDDHDAQEVSHNWVDDAVDQEETLSWIVAAVTADANTQEVSNDG